ncbi:MAG: rod-binding protein [Aestuariivirga sp.]|uniref:rod-binding protein n=1 Tax=Aestuariivirga sp. TaxID=2650926 RepID=UPI0030175B5D
MAVSLPSDLVFDVMRNADPVRHSVALAKLRSAGHDSGAAFASAVKNAEERSGLLGVSGDLGTGVGLLAPHPNAIHDAVDNSTAYQGFERMVLRNLFETLLPDEQSGAFGEGPSAGIWRSMAADQFAGIYAENGGIGLAAMLTSGGGEKGPRREIQWPYFSMAEIGTVRG